MAFGDRYYVAMQEGYRDVSSGKYGITNVGQMYNEGGSSEMQVLSLKLIWARCFLEASDSMALATSPGDTVMSSSGGMVSRC